jgi:HEAT repeat protein
MVMKHKQIKETANQKPENKQNEFLAMKPAEPEDILKDKAGNKAEESKKDVQKIAKAINELSRSSPQEKREAINALAELDYTELEAALIKVMREERTPEKERVMAAQALGKIKALKELPMLIDSVKEYNIYDLITNRMPSWNYGKDEDKGIRALAWIMNKDENHAVREEVARIMGEIDDQRFIPQLMTALKYDENAKVREAAIRALAKLSDPYAIIDMGGTIKEHKEWIVRKLKARKQVVPELIKAMQKDSSCRVRAAAAEMLGKLKDRQAIPHLMEVAKNEKEDDEVKFYAIEALGNMRAKKAIPLLGEIATKKDAPHTLRKESVRSLAKMKDQAAIPALVEVLKTGEGIYEVYTAFVALLQIKKISDPRILVEQMEEKEVFKRLLYLHKKDDVLTVIDLMKQKEILKSIDNLSEFIKLDQKILDILHGKKFAEYLKTKPIQDSARYYGYE